MNGYMAKGILMVELMIAFVGVFWWIREKSMVHNVVARAYRALKRQKTLLARLDGILLYSGLHRRFPVLTPEIWILLELAGLCILCFVAAVWKLGVWVSILLIFAYAGVQYLILSFLMTREYNATDENLLKFLDFLGNYSITSGEVTSVLYQISGYLDEPLRSVLEECYYEARTLGDTGMALFSMAGKIQHPKFGEVIRNIEVTMRYSADFTILVSQSRRAVREHMRMRQERKSLAKEAGVNMLILGAMTIVIFKTVETLVNISIREVLLYSWAGRGCLLGIGMILFLFYRQVRGIDR